MHPGARVFQSDQRLSSSRNQLAHLSSTPRHWANKVCLRLEGEWHMMAHANANSCGVHFEAQLWQEVGQLLHGMRHRLQALHKHVGTPARGYCAAWKSTRNRKNSQLHALFGVTALSSKDLAVLA